MGKAMKFRARLLAVLLSLPPVAGCSLILDPENCSSDDDCLPGGACKSGVCIGGVEAAGGADANTGGAPSGGTPDASGGGLPPDGTPGGADVPPMLTDMGVGGAVTPDAGDAAIPPDMLPPADEPPTCVVLAPPDADDGIVLAQERLSVTVLVTDPDTTRDRLTVTVNGAPAALDDMNTATLDLPLVEGSNTFTLEARDPEGHRCMARREVVRDLTGPALEVTAADGSEIGNDFQTGDSPLVLRIVATDANGVSDVSGTARNVRLDQIEGPTDDVWTATVMLADGTNAVEITAMDAYGNTSVHPLTVFYDGQDPVLDIDFPVEGQLVEANSIDVRGNVSDNLDLAAVRISVEVSAVNHDPYTTPIQRAGADGTYRFANVPLFNGDNTVTVKARDAVRESTSVVHLRVEPGAPTVDFTDPPPGSDFITGSADLHLVGSASRSVTEVDVGPPGNTTTVVPANGRWTADLRLASRGAYAISAVGRTPGGRASTPATLNVVFDDTPPTVRINGPIDGFCTAAPTMQVEGEAFDDDNTAVRVALVNDTPFDVDQVRHTFRDSIAVAPGIDQTLTVSAENAAGLSATATRQFSVDRTGPLLTLDRPDGAWVAADDAGNIEVRGTIFDEGCGLARLPLLVNGTETLATPEGEFLARQNRGLNPHIVVVGTDIVGNQTRLEVDYRVDAEAPLVTNVDPPLDLAQRGANIAVSAEVADAGSGLATVTIGGLAAPLVGGRYTRNIALAPGDNAIDIVATDNVGLVRTVTRHINRDTTPPVVTITSPANNSSVEDKLIIEGTIADGDTGSGIDHVTVGNIDVSPAPDGTWRHVGLPLLAGQQTITVVGFDAAGNQSQAVNVSVTVRDFGASDSMRNGLTGATQTRWTGAADLDADGRLDLLALTDAPDGESRIFKQLANGTFEAHPVTDYGLPANLRVNDAALADLNNDARFDLIVAAPGGASTVFMGDRVAGFVEIVSPAYPVAGDATGLALGDIDRDGSLDVIFLAGADTAVRKGVFGGGAVDLPLLNLGNPDLSAMTQAELMDLNTDGIQDLVAVGPNGSRAWYGEVDARFTEFDALGAAFGNVPGHGLFLLDTDRDRDLDVVTIGASHAVHQTGLVGADIASFTTGPSGLVAAAGDEGGAGADFDGDARDDVVVFGSTGAAFFGGSAVGFSARPLANLGLPANLPASRTGLAVDIDADGDVDVITAGAAGLTLLRNNVTTTRVGVGNTYTYLRVLATRALDGMAPVDATGVIVYSDPLAANPAANRALVHPPTSPLVVTFGTAARIDLNIQWIEKDGGGDNTISVANQRPQAANAVPINRQPPE